MIQILFLQFELTHCHINCLCWLLNP